MTKHRQSKSLGNIETYITETESESPCVLLSDVERIEALERRVRTLEALLNDVMLQLDKPFEDEETSAKAKPKAKSKGKEKPDEATQLKSLTALLADGDLFTEKQLIKRAKLTHRVWHTSLKNRIANDTNPDENKRLYHDKDARDKRLLQELCDLLANGKKLTEFEIHEAMPELSKNRFLRIKRHLKNDENPDRETRLYFVDDNSEPA